ncbi:hypothetical protein [Halopiger goleimassiliensis]|uniref:hypothetical protein n=1 Tax=Halopiger goleimassiliensis TaxID=1293048 RepID=UPI00067827FC|nr:hypothetical protein [Halopiger goleimassiliensis]
MAATRVTTPRLDLGVALLAITLLAAPLVTSVVGVDETTYRYERVEVTTDGAAVEYADESRAPDDRPLGGELACSNGSPGGWEIRPCTFERTVLENGTVPTEFATGSSGPVDPPFPERYGYVSIDGTVYETAYVANDSPRDDGSHRIDLTLEPSSADAALADASHDVASRAVPATAAEAARTGSATASHPVEVPERPIRLEDDTYYRVFLAETVDPSWRLHVGLTYLAPLSGVALLGYLSRRIEVTYVGGSRRR